MCKENPCTNSKIRLIKNCLTRPILTKSNFISLLLFQKAMLLSTSKNDCIGNSAWFLSRRRSVRHIILFRIHYYYIVVDTIIISSTVIVVKYIVYNLPILVLQIFLQDPISYSIATYSNTTRISRVHRVDDGVVAAHFVSLEIFIFSRFIRDAHIFTSTFKYKIYVYIFLFFF